VVKVDGVASAATPALRTAAGFTKGVAKRFTVPEIDWTRSGAAQNAEALTDGTTFNRIEDGAFDPRNPNDYYFLTTEGGDTAQAEPGVTRDGGGLWRLRYDDVSRPELGGTVTLLLDGTEAPFLNKPDNMAIDAHGDLLMQEDPGGNDHVARIVAYRIEDGARGVVAEFDPARFAAGAPGLITTDEESSGIIDVSSQVGQKGTFLFDAQVHKPNADPELVEQGQLLRMTVQAWGQVYRITD
jgi:secreted PhoX family phosphatase